MNIKTISQSLVDDTRPDPEQFNEATEVFWKFPLAKILSGKFSLGRNHAGVGFTATFKVLDDDLQLTLTPEQRSKDGVGETYTHLRTMRWMTEAWKLRRAAMSKAAA